MPRELVVRTPENVEITHSLAGIGSRFIALLIDHLIQGLSLLLLLMAAVILVFGIQDWFNSLDELNNLSSWTIGLLIFAYFLLIWGYFIFFEAFWNGQTPGKRMVKIRVVKENGSPVDFAASAIRNIVRLIDSLPSGYAVGLVSMFFSPAYKRLGDYAAGTVVVKEYRRPPVQTSDDPTPPANEAAPDSLNAGPEPWIPGEPDAPPEEIPGVTINGIRSVTREEYDAARRFLDRRADLTNTMSASFARRIAEPILARLDMTPDDPDAYPYELFLETLALDYLRWQDRGF